MDLSQEVVEILKKTFDNSSDKLELIDEKHDQRHWFLKVVSDKFAGKSRLERSRMIYEHVGYLMKDDHIHALRMELKTPQEVQGQ